MSGATNSINYIFANLRHVNRLHCDVSFMRRFYNSPPFKKPYLSLKKITIDGAVIGLDPVCLDFLENLHKNFPNLKEINLILLVMEDIKIIPEQCYDLITSLNLENHFDSIVQTLETVKYSMPNCRALEITLQTDDFPDFQKLEEFDNITSLEFNCYKMKLEDIHDIMNKMPMLFDLIITTSILDSELSHEEIVNLFGDSLTKLRKFKIGIRVKMENVDFKTMRFLNMQTKQVCWDDFYDF